MSIKEIALKIKGLGGVLEKKEVFLFILILCVSFSSFALGRLSLSGQELKQTIKFTRWDTDLKTNTPPQTASVGLSIKGGQFVASKNGTKYYPLDCAGVSKIKEENKIFFNSTEEAEAGGYTEALNCN